ncbi:MAG: hypothetical protein H7Y17_03555 [Chlorobia bacterium]|nr:hypothetical protein [Fimbriimonadaceae bacterium]
MKTTTLLSLSLLLCLVSSGCSSGDAANSSTTAPAATPVANQEMAKCAGCGKEVATAELASHDGQMMCKECIAAHNH